MHHLDKRREVGLHQGLGVERRQAPALALGVVRVWRGTDLEPEDDHLLEGPRVGAAGIETDREIGDHVHTRMAGVPVLLAGHVLRPDVETHPFGVLGGEPPDPDRVGVAQFLRPASPVGVLLVLGDHRPDREALQLQPLRQLPSPELDVRLVLDDVPDALQRLVLQRPDLIAVDHAFFVERSAGPVEVGQVDPFGSVDRARCDVQHVQEQPTGRRIGRGLRLRERRDRVHR